MRTPATGQIIPPYYIGSFVKGGVYANTARLSRVFLHKSKFSGANMAKDNTSQYSGYKRTNSSALSLWPVIKKRYTPITNFADPNYKNMEKVDMDLDKTTKDMASSQSSWKDRLQPSKDFQNTSSNCQRDHSYCRVPYVP